MKYVLALVLVSVGVAIGVGMGGGSPSNASVTRDTGPLDVQIGDEVRLYLDRSRSGGQAFLVGRVEAIDSVQYCLRSASESSVTGGPPDRLYRTASEVLQFVPRAAVLYVERATKEQIVSTTRPQS